ncbi:MAG: Fe-S cluster assembly protein SufB [Candidatus Kerfeldbacteria bacterium]|nr:Fe-S cluster assembly protein SufB [Candidatus Kerfeldbacteria bacterium]
MSASFTNKQYEYGFYDKVKPYYILRPGLSKRVVEEISHLKNEPGWMQERRRLGYDFFVKRPLPNWGPSLRALDFSKLRYYATPLDKTAAESGYLPSNVKKTFTRLGIPPVEVDFLTGSGAQYDSEMVYHALKKDWQDRGVIFCSMDEAIKKHSEIVAKYFGTIITANDNKLAALNTAVWSGGSFVYIPRNVKLDKPLQTYFRLNARNLGQFERTLIIAEEGSEVHYVEGCTAPVYNVDSLHAAVVEIIVKPYARVRYTTVQNWSNNVYNLVTKRAYVEEGGMMEWIDGNFGSQLTMKYPSVILAGHGAKAEIMSLAVAGASQHQDAGSKAIHLASDTSSNILSKSIAHHGGRTSYRGLIKVAPKAANCKIKVKCDALLTDNKSQSDTYPTMDIKNSRTQTEHEATVTRVGEEQLFYLQSRGLSESEATSMIVSGFIEPIARELPQEFAIELNRLINLEMDGSVG